MNKGNKVKPLTRLQGPPDRVATYFLSDKIPLMIVTISGLIYNIGIAAGPLFEGKLAQELLNVLGGKSAFGDMVRTALLYTLVIAIVQIARYYKRLFVRRFANDLNRNMKHVIYRNLVFKSKQELDHENIGSVMTKAISDVEACAEGMRKFTTEIFDTGIAMASFLILLLIYDWRLTILCMIFPPISYLLAERMKTVVQKSNARLKESSGALSAATLDRVQGALVYRVYGCEEERNNAYEKCLDDYERKAIRANIWVSSMQPLYKVISMAGVLFILYFGAKNVAGTGWTTWDIAAFTAFLSCFAKLSVKSSHAAKLFNAVHKAQVSWKRIKPLMKELPEQPQISEQNADTVTVENLGFAYPGKTPVFTGMNFEAHAGEIIGITGPVACGKSTFGKVFLNENPYMGSVRIDGRELSSFDPEVHKCMVGYLGHDPEVMSASVKDNIALGDNRIDVNKYLRLVCLDKEVSEMPEGMDTQVGSGGIRLSGGQQQRLALARTLAHYRPVLILDDPFSALDRDTELEIFRNLRSLCTDRVVFLASHRLYLFPEMDQVIWMDNGRCTVSDHSHLTENCPSYASLYNAQEGGVR